MSIDEINSCCSIVELNDIMSTHSFKDHIGDRKYTIAIWRAFARCYEYAFRIDSIEQRILEKKSSKEIMNEIRSKLSELHFPNLVDEFFQTAKRPLELDEFVEEVRFLGPPPIANRLLNISINPIYDAVDNIGVNEPSDEDGVEEEDGGISSEDEATDYINCCMPSRRLSGDGILSGYELNRSNHYGVPIGKTGAERRAEIDRIRNAHNYSQHVNHSDLRKKQMELMNEMKDNQTIQKLDLTNAQGIGDCSILMDGEGNEKRLFLGVISNDGFEKPEKILQNRYEILRWKDNPAFVKHLNCIEKDFIGTEFTVRNAKENKHSSPFTRQEYQKYLQFGTAHTIQEFELIQRTFSEILSHSGWLYGTAMFRCLFMISYSRMNDDLLKACRITLALEVENTCVPLPVDENEDFLPIFVPNELIQKDDGKLKYAFVQTWCALWLYFQCENRKHILECGYMYRMLYPSLKKRNLHLDEECRLRVMVKCWKQLGLYANADNLLPKISVSNENAFRKCIEEINHGNMETRNKEIVSLTDISAYVPFLLTEEL